MKYRFFLLTLVLTSISCLALFIINPVYAAYDDEDIKEVYSGWTYEGGNFSVENKLFTVKSAGSDKLRISINFDGKTMIMMNGSCEQSDEYFLCYEGAKFFEYNKEIDKVIDQYMVRIKRIVPKVEFTKRVISNDNLFKWEEAEITTTFKNTGNVDIDEVNFSEVFPETFEVTHVTNCRLTGNLTVSWKGTMPEGKIVECSYRIKPLSATDIITYAKASYRDGASITQSISNGLPISVSKPKIVINSSLLEYNGLSVGNNIDLNIALSNTEKETDVIISRFEVIPKGLKLLKHSNNLIQDNSIFHFSGKIVHGNKVRLNLSFLLEKSGQHQIEENLVYFIAGKRIEVTETETLSIEVDNISTSVWLSENNSTSGEKNMIKIRALNMGNNSYFKDIKVKIQSPVPEINSEAGFNELLSKNHKIVMDKYFTPPEVRNQTDFPVTITTEYYTIYGESLSSIFKYNLSVYPRTENITTGSNRSVNDQSGLNKSVEQNVVIEDLTSQRKNSSITRMWEKRNGKIITIAAISLLLAAVGAGFWIKKKRSNYIPDDFSIGDDKAEEGTKKEYTLSDEEIAVKIQDEFKEKDSELEVDTQINSKKDKNRKSNKEEKEVKGDSFRF